MTDLGAAEAVSPGGLALGAASLADVARASDLRRIHILAWRDLDDPEAGGSELHAHRIATLWAGSGIDVTVRTSVATGHPAFAERSGYRVVRKAGRYMVFPRTALSGRLGRDGTRDALVEIWNGMPFFSPAWAACPAVVFLHHVHAEMWRMVLSPFLARVGETIEFRIAPHFYRDARIVTLSASSRAEIMEMLGLPGRNITVVPPGVEDRFSPGESRSPRPLVVAVGRLVPVKRFDMLVDALVSLRREHPDLEATIVGEGYERPALERQIRARGAEEWLQLPGRISDDGLVSLYRRAWVLASASVREGWGMTVTEAGACATPAVVTRIAGHSDAVDHGRTGFLASGPAELNHYLDLVLRHGELRRRLGAASAERAHQLTWEATARGTLLVLAEEAARYRRR